MQFKNINNKILQIDIAVNESYYNKSIQNHCFSYNFKILTDQQHKRLEVHARALRERLPTGERHQHIAGSISSSFIHEQFVLHLSANAQWIRVNLKIQIKRILFSDDDSILDHRRKDHCITRISSDRLDSW